MFNLKNGFVFLFLLVLIACGKKEGVTNTNNSNGAEDPGTNQPEPTESSPLNIYKALFTNPEKIKAKSESTVIMDELIKYLKYTPKGADVHISIFLCYYIPVVNAIKDAANRGVNVYMLIDSSQSGSGGSREKNEATISQLRYTFSHSFTKSKLVAVNNQITSSAINHEKIALFSEINLPEGVAKNVVVVTSHNFIESGMKRAQDAVIMTHKTLYDIFISHWSKVAALANMTMNNFEYEEEYLEDTLAVFFFPRRKNGNWDGKETIIEQLEQLKNPEGDTIRVLMAGWSGDRGMDIAKKLTSLYTQGAVVEVITNNDKGEDLIAELNKLKAPGGRLMLMNSSSSTAMSNHSKTVLIKSYENGEKQTTILTGSKNFYTGGLQYSNNVVLKLKNSYLFNDYWDNFEKYRAAFN